MTEVQRRYATDPLAMARLLDALVDFLRAAMPGVRGGSSTLLAELSLATLYVKVRSELEPGRHTWAIHTDGPMPDLPFPALMLLPVLDQLAAVDAADIPRTVLRVSQANGYCTLTIDHSGARPGSWFPAELLHRLQV